VTEQVDDIAALGDLCQRRGAWFHVDAIWGAALAYSTVETTRDLLKGLDYADSVALGPQKWMFAPRLCALTLFPKMQSAPEFDATLAAVMPYSARRDDDDGGSVSNANRGTWGLQGSRRADCLALFATLQVLGREGMGRYVDDSIALTREFHATVLARLGVGPAHTSSGERLRVAPTHTPQLNLLNLRVNDGASVKSVFGAFSVL
jgi:glutamate/tyrosine decarboxylase-like PLP-dependent enzyme